MASVVVEQNGDFLEQKERLLRALAEHAQPSGWLWQIYWPPTGEDKDGEFPSIIAEIGRHLKSCSGGRATGGGRSQVVLVHGRYGTGKSSFLNLLAEYLKTSSGKDREGEEGSKEDGSPLICRINLSTLTSQIESSSLAVVMARIAMDLAKYVRSKDPCRCQELLDSLHSRLDDLWRMESGGGFQAADGHHAPPEPNRMAGADGVVRRAVDANTLEERLDECLGEMGKGMVVMIDDLDRCPRKVAKDIIRLLLRFGSTRRIHFVLASDWDVLEQGVRDWMDAYGRHEDGYPLVTANSALEKYVHIPIELPDMGAALPVGEDSTQGGDWREKALAEMSEKLKQFVEDWNLSTVDDETLGDPILAEILIADILLQGMKEDAQDRRPDRAGGRSDRGGER